MGFRLPTSTGEFTAGFLVAINSIPDELENPYGKMLTYNISNMTPLGAFLPQNKHLKRKLCLSK